MFARAPRSVVTLLVWAAVALAFFCSFVDLPGASAIGISPPYAKIDFVPNQRYDFSVNLINNNDFPVEIDTRTEGFLANAVAIKKPIRIAPRSSTPVSISVVVPPSLETPGYHTTYIFFAERYVDTSKQTVSVRTEVGLRLSLWQPYPGQYAEIVASAPSVARGNDTVLKLLVNNLGADAITDGQASVKVRSASGVLENTYAFPDIQVPGNSNKDFYETVPASTYEPGKYYLEAFLRYGNNSTNMTGSFAVGTQDIDILQLEGPFYMDKPVNRYTIHLESLWNLPIDGVYADLELGGSKSTTSPISLNGFSQGGLTGFWETDKSVPTGQALAHVTLHYPGGTKESLLAVPVYNETPKPPDYQEPSKPIEVTAADVIFLIIAIILLALAAFYAFRKMDENRRPPASPPGVSGGHETSGVASSSKPQAKQ